MPAVITDVTRLGPGSYTYTWTITTAPSTIFQDGNELASGLDEDILTYSVTGADTEEPPVLEIVDSHDLDNVKGVLSEQFPPFAIVQWRSIDPTIELFEVWQKIATVWTLVKRVSDNDNGYYRFVSLKLTDVTTHEFRVRKVDVQEYTSPYAQFEITMVRVPDAPSIDHSYDQPSLLQRN